MLHVIINMSVFLSLSLQPTHLANFNQVQSIQYSALEEKDRKGMLQLNVAGAPEVKTQANKPCILYHQLFHCRLVIAWSGDIMFGLISHVIFGINHKCIKLLNHMNVCPYSHPKLYFIFLLTQISTTVCLYQIQNFIKKKEIASACQTLKLKERVGREENMEGHGRVKAVDAIYT